MSRQFRGKTIKPDNIPSKTAQDFLDAARAYETTCPMKRTHRDNRTKFSTVLMSAMQSGVASSHELKKQFGLTNRHIQLTRDGRSAKLPKETREKIISSLTQKALSIVAA